MPFVPLAFWNSIIGKFMFFLPITLIITLIASLLVAYIINPVFAVSFMKPHLDHDDAVNKPRFNKRDKVLSVIFGAIALMFYLAHSWAVANSCCSFMYSSCLKICLLQMDPFIPEQGMACFQGVVYKMAETCIAPPGTRNVYNDRSICYAPITYGLRHVPLHCSLHRILISLMFILISRWVQTRHIPTR